MLATNPAVIEMFNNYHAKVNAGQTELYQPASQPDYVVVCLPRELNDYKESSAGHHGYDSGCDPIGIKRYVPGGNRTAYLNKVFASPESLAAFIATSDGSGVQYGRDEYTRITAQRQAASQIITIDPLDRPISEYNLQTLYGPGIIMQLRTKFPKTIMDDYRVLTRREFEARYALTAVESAELA